MLGIRIAPITMAIPPVRADGYAFPLPLIQGQIMQFAKATILLVVCMAASFLASTATSSAQEEKPEAPIETVDDPNKTDAIHEQLRALREDFIAAVNAKDYDAVVTLLHPEVILTAQDGKKLSIIRRHDGVRKYLNRLLVGLTHGVDSMKLNPKMDDLPVLYFDNTAIAFGSSQFQYRLVNGNEFDLKKRWSVTVVKEGDRWLLANLHVSTNLFDNAVLQTVSRMAIWLAIGSGAISLVVGFIAGRLFFRKVDDLTY